jgi:hypothetical protein
MPWRRLMSRNPEVRRDQAAGRFAESAESQVRGMFDRGSLSGPGSCHGGGHGAEAAAGVGDLHLTAQSRHPPNLRLVPLSQGATEFNALLFPPSHGNNLDWRAFVATFQGQFDANVRYAVGLIGLWAASTIAIDQPSAARE